MPLRYQRIIKIGWTLNLSNFLIVKDFYNNSNPFHSWHLRNGSSKNPLSCKIYHIKFACTQAYVTIMHKTIFSWEAMISFNLSRKRQIWNRIMFQYFSFRSRSSDMTPPPEVRRIPTVISSPHRISVSSSGILMISIYSKFDINRRSSVDHPGTKIKLVLRGPYFLNQNRPENYFVEPLDFRITSACRKRPNKLRL